jgi:hypothetical protein
MDTSKIGGKNDSDLVSNASPLRKLDTSSRLQRARESALELKNRMRVSRPSVTGQFTVALNAENHFKGVARTLTKAEVEDLRKTKHAVAQRIVDTLK